MKKTISFEKKIEFPSMIGEITAIDLEHTLQFTDCSTIEGDLIVSGKYKLTEASRLEEDFSYNLPTDIFLTECLDLETTTIDIDDFYYEIENDYNLICHIDIKVEGVEIIDIKEESTIIDSEEIQNELPISDALSIQSPYEKIPIEKEEHFNRECDGDNHQEKMEAEEMLETKETTTNVSSLFENINETEETYATYSVYILREEETVTSIIEKYKTTKEDLEAYNDLSTLTIGSKVIIPVHETEN